MYNHCYVNNERFLKKTLNLYISTLICTLVDDPYLLNAKNKRFMTRSFCVLCIILSKQESFTKYPWENLVPLRMHEKTGQKLDKHPGISLKFRTFLKFRKNMKTHWKTNRVIENSNSQLRYQSNSTLHRLLRFLFSI